MLACSTVYGGGCHVARPKLGRTQKMKKPNERTIRGDRVIGSVVFAT